MNFLRSLHERRIIQSYSPKPRNVRIDFVIQALKCHKDDQHYVKGLDSERDVPPFACSFNQSLVYGHMLSVADEEGGVCLYDTRKHGPSARLKGWVAHSNAIFDVAWVGNEAKLVTASGDQTAQLWDIHGNARLGIFKGHSCSLKAVDFQCHNQSVFATGARDGNVMVWDMRCNKRCGYHKPVNTIHNCHTISSTVSGTPPRIRRRGRRPSSVVKPDSQQSVTSVIFQDYNTLISAGAMDGTVKVWDLRKNYSNLEKAPLPCQAFPCPQKSHRKHGFSSLTLDSTKSRLFANCTNDVIYMYDAVTFQKEPLAKFRGHSNVTFYVKSSVSPDDQYLLSGSGDYDGYIWKIDDPQAAPFHLLGHTNEVTSVAWCPGNQSKVVTCSDDTSFYIWNVNYAERKNGNFVGWCEQVSPSETEDGIPGSSDSGSPVSSKNNSTSTLTSLSLPSPTTTKCSSPQQLLYKWLQTSEVTVPNRVTKSSSIVEQMNSVHSNGNKRSREVDNDLTLSKHVCMWDEVEKIGKSASNDPKTSNSVSSKIETQVEKAESDIMDKENKVPNANIIVGSQPLKETKMETSLPLPVHRNIGSCLSSTSGLLNSISQMSPTNSLLKETTVASEKKKFTHPIRKSNWLRDMGVKKKSVKTRNVVPSKLENISTNVDRVAVLTNTRSITNYFTPMNHNSSN